MVQGRYASVRWVSFALRMGIFWLEYDTPKYELCLEQVTPDWYVLKATYRKMHKISANKGHRQNF